MPTRKEIDEMIARNQRAMANRAPLEGFGGVVDSSDAFMDEKIIPDKKASAEEEIIPDQEPIIPDGTPQDRATKEYIKRITGGKELRPFDGQTKTQPMPVADVGKRDFAEDLGSHAKQAFVQPYRGWLRQFSDKESVENLDRRVGARPGADAAVANVGSAIGGVAGMLPAMATGPAGAAAFMGFSGTGSALNASNDVLDAGGSKGMAGTAAALDMASTYAGMKIFNAAGLLTAPIANVGQNIGQVALTGAAAKILGEGEDVQNLYSVFDQNRMMVDAMVGFAGPASRAVGASAPRNADATHSKEVIAKMREIGEEIKYRDLVSGRSILYSENVGTAIKRFDAYIKDKNMPEPMALEAFKQRELLKEKKTTLTKATKDWAVAYQKWTTADALEKAKERRASENPYDNEAGMVDKIWELLHPDAAKLLWRDAEASEFPTAKNWSAWEMQDRMRNNDENKIIQLILEDKEAFDSNILLDQVEIPDYPLSRVVDLYKQHSTLPEVKEFMTALGETIKRWEEAGYTFGWDLERKKVGGAHAMGVTHTYAGKHTDVGLDPIYGVNSIIMGHEGAHAVTVRLIEAVINNPEFAKANKPLRDAVQQLEDVQANLKFLVNNMDEANLPAELRPIAEHFKNNTNLFEDLHEMLAWGVTQPGVQALLNHLNYGPKGTYLVDNLKKAIFESIGIPYTEATKTGLSRVLDSYDLMRNVPGSVFDNPILHLQKEQALGALTKSPMPLTQNDLQSARHSFEKWYEDQQALNGGALPDKYKLTDAMMRQAIQDLKTADPGAEAMLIPLSEEGFYNYIQGKPFTAEKDGASAFYVLKYEGKENGFEQLVVNFEHNILYNTIKDQFPALHFGSAREAIYAIKNGNTVDAAARPWIKAMDDVVSIDHMPQPLYSQLPEDVQAALRKVKEFTDIRDPVLAKKILMQDKDLDSNWPDLLTNGPDSRAVTTGNAAVRWLRGELARAIGTQSEISREVVTPLALQYHKFTADQKNQVMRTLFLGDELGVNFKYADLIRGGMDADSAKFVIDVRRTMDWMLDFWNVKRASLGQPPIPRRDGYFPGKFSGDYKAIGLMEGKVVGVVTANTKWQLKARMKEMTARGAVDDWSKIDRRSLAQEPITSRSAFDDFDRIINMLGPEAEAVQQFRSIADEITKLEADRLYGFNMHEKFKKGVWGNAGEEPWFSDPKQNDSGFATLVKYIEEGTLHHELSTTLDGLNFLISDAQVGAAKPKTKKYLEAMYYHITHGKHPTSGEIPDALEAATKVGKGFDNVVDAALLVAGVGPSFWRGVNAKNRQIFNATTMGLGNAAFTAVQLLQPITNAQPIAAHLRAQFGLDVLQSRGSAAKASMAITRYFLERSTGKRFGADFIGGDAETRQALKYAEHRNLINFAEIDTAIEQTGNPNTAKWDMAFNANQRFAESATRPLVFMQMYYIARDGNIPQQKALEIARNATEFTMGAYHSLQRPIIYSALGTYGAALGQLKVYPHSDIAQKRYALDQALVGKGWGLMSLAGLYLAINGLENIPLYDEFDFFFKWLNKRAYGKQDGLKEQAIKDLPEWVNKGYLSSALNLDIQGRLKVNPLFDIQDPIASIIPANYSWIFQIAKAGLKFKDSQLEQDKKNFLYKAAPSSIKGPLENLWYKSENEKRNEGVPTEREEWPSGLKKSDATGGAWKLNQKGGLDQYRSKREWDLRMWGARSLEESQHTQMVFEGNEESKSRSALVKDTLERVISHLDAGGKTDLPKFKGWMLTLGKSATETELKQIERELLMRKQDALLSTLERAKGGMNEGIRMRNKDMFDYYPQGTAR